MTTLETIKRQARRKGIRVTKNIDGKRVPLSAKELARKLKLKIASVEKENATEIKSYRNLHRKCRELAKMQTESPLIYGKLYLKNRQMVIPSSIQNNLPSVQKVSHKRVPPPPPPMMAPPPPMMAPPPPPMLKPVPKRNNNKRANTNVPKRNFLNELRAKIHKGNIKTIN
jgi:hypothetical protein